jgi:hypothetical protein
MWPESGGSFLTATGWAAALLSRAAALALCSIRLLTRDSGSLIESVVHEPLQLRWGLSVILRRLRAAFRVVLAVGGISIVTGCSLWRSIEDLFAFIGCVVRVRCFPLR